MFNYDTDVVINDLKAADLVYKAATSESAGDALVIIKRIGNYKEGTIENLSTVVTGAAGSCGSIDLSGAKGSTSGDLIRVYFKIACSSKYAEFAMANWGAFEKPVMVEFVSNGSTVAPLVAALKQVLDPEVATVSDAGVVTLTETVYSIVPESVKAVTVTTECNECNGYNDEVEEEISDVAAPTAPVEGKGTYEYLIQNLRYPTRENLRYAAPNADEMPIKGALYDQLAFDIVVTRENPAGGLSAAGQVITSKTHHVLFVNQNSTKNAAAIRTELAKLLQD